MLSKCRPADDIGVAVPVIETPEHIKAAERATREINAAYLPVMLEGKYIDEYLTATGKDAPIFSDQELRVISTPVDFIGINLYQPRAYVMASDQVQSRAASHLVRAMFCAGEYNPLLVTRSMSSRILTFSCLSGARKQLRSLLSKGTPRSSLARLKIGSFSSQPLPGDVVSIDTEPF